MKRLLNLFGDRLAALPLLVLYLTDGCNSRCAMCDIWRNPRRNMSQPLVESLLADAAALDMRWLLLSGGEAMQHPNWDGIARQFKQQGVYVMLLTNGLYLARDAERLTGAVDEVIVSLDAASPATYQAIRGVDGFETVLQGIRAACALNIPVITRTTVQQMNYAELPALVDVALKVGVNRVSFLPIDVSNAFAFGGRDLKVAPQGALTLTDCDAFEHVLTGMQSSHAAAFANGQIAEPYHKLQQMVAYFRALHDQAEYAAPRCNAPHISTVIEVDGTVRPCYFLPSVGKVGAGGLRAALNSEAAQAMRHAYRTGQRLECARCVCPLYKGVRALATM
jgi:MoaA/NifB/PqqE/SkfB family radical SAM enzyme